MAKKVIAKTNIDYGKADGEVVKIAVGEEVDTKGLGMTKKQLEDLYDAGAVDIEETADTEEAPAAEETPAAPVKSAPTKAAPSGKSNAA